MLKKVAFMQSTPIAFSKIVWFNIPNIHFQTIKYKYLRGKGTWTIVRANTIQARKTVQMHSFQVSVVVLLICSNFGLHPETAQKTEDIFCNLKRKNINVKRAE